MNPIELEWQHIKKDEVAGKMFDEETTAHNGENLTPITPLHIPLHTYKLSPPTYLTPVHGKDGYNYA